MTTRTNAITHQEANRSGRFYDEPAFSAFSDGYIAVFGDGGYTAYDNPYYEDPTRTDAITSTTVTWTGTLS